MSSATTATGCRKMKLGKITGFLIDRHRRQLLRKTACVLLSALFECLPEGS
jgi:hypothetical protein